MDILSNSLPCIPTIFAQRSTLSWAVAIASKYDLMPDLSMPFFKIRSIDLVNIYSIVDRGN
jgi:hypothetical protein